MIRSAQENDVPILRDIERDAGRVFADIGMLAVAEDEPPSAETLLGYIREERAWVHTVDGEPVAYVMADLVDGNAHIEQVSLRSAHAGHRIGAGLIDHVDAWAARTGAAALTLTTFTEVPLVRALLPAVRLPVAHGRRAHAGVARHPSGGGRTRPGPLAARMHAPRTPRLNPRSARLVRADDAAGREESGTCHPRR